MFLLKHTLTHVENLFTVFAALDMSYDEKQELCAEAWKNKDYFSLCIDKSRKKMTENMQLVMKKFPIRL